MNKDLQKLVFSPFIKNINNLQLSDCEKVVCEAFGESNEKELFLEDIKYEGRSVGSLKIEGSSQLKNDLLELIPRLSVLLSNSKKQDYLFKVLSWVEEARCLAPDICDWIGVYFKASYLFEEDGTDLVLGPFIGEATDHIRIPLNRGFCGMALREEKTVNVKDVTADDTHIACSLKTRSELVIPLKGKGDDYIAELDIDCNQLNAFSKDIEETFQKFCLSFPNI